jgi:cell division protein FtsI (penicillin-binding protein 3)
VNIKNEILVRIYFILFGMVVPLAGILVYKTFYLSVIEGDKWRKKGQSYLEYRPIEAQRGNIYAWDGSLLATSIPYFDLYFDPHASSANDYNQHIDSLAFYLSKHIDKRKSKEDYLLILRNLRKSTNRHVLLKKNVSYLEKDLISSFPLFRLGRFRGGLIIEKKSERNRPFGMLAQRTIGYVREGALPVGLEGYYDKELGGTPGKQLMFQVGKEVWMPVEDLAQIHPKSGYDIQTTIDIDFQDITHEALLNAMQKHDATWGTAVVMEVSTGAIKAISNLGISNGNFHETYNHAIATLIEPGSTFKLASIMALLEDRKIKLEDSLDIEGGVTFFYDKQMKDSNPSAAKSEMVSIRQIFENSSNVGMAKLINKHYSTNPEEFLESLSKFRLDKKTDFALDGEGTPYFKNPKNEKDHWSGISLPWMSIGYELKMTPLQILSFYNAVANQGTYMQPYIVSQILRNGEKIESFSPKILKRKMASSHTIETVMDLLNGVVERGTAKSLKQKNFSFSGKTGTSQIDYKRIENQTLIGGHQASFVGFFPSHDPIYSCIVVINNPRKNGYYGREVAAPVFVEIARKAFASKRELQPRLSVVDDPNKFAYLPMKGNPSDYKIIAKEFGVPVARFVSSEIVDLKTTEDGLFFKEKLLPDNLVPDVRGMGLRDAVYILENRGLKTIAKGYGKVLRQSITPGTKIKGQSIILYLE